MWCRVRPASLVNRFSLWSSQCCFIRVTSNTLAHQFELESCEFSSEEFTILWFLWVALVRQSFDLTESSRLSLAVKKFCFDEVLIKSGKSFAWTVSPPMNLWIKRKWLFSENFLTGHIKSVLRCCGVPGLLTSDFPTEFRFSDWSLEFTTGHITANYHRQGIPKCALTYSTDWCCSAHSAYRWARASTCRSSTATRCRAPTRAMTNAAVRVDAFRTS